MSRGVYVRGVSVQEGICPGVTVRGVHVRGGYVLEPFSSSSIPSHMNRSGPLKWTCMVTRVFNRDIDDMQQHYQLKTKYILQVVSSNRQGI